MSALRWAFGALVATSLSLSLDACRPCGQTATETDVGTLVRWDFEPGCDDANCGWAGVQGDVRITPLVHPGERGLTLGPSSSARVPLRSLDAQSAGVTVRMVMRCDEGTALRVTLTAAPSSDGGGTQGDASFEAPSIGEPSWRTQSAEFSPNIAVSSLRWLTVSTEGAGSCQLDQVRLISRDFFFGLCE